MKISRKLELLEEQIAAAQDGNPPNLKGWREKTDVVLRTALGEGSALHRRFKNVRYTPVVITGTTDFSAYRQSGVRRAVAILNAAKTEVELTSETPTALTETVKDVTPAGGPGQ
jgi:hypothetical protein